MSNIPSVPETIRGIADAIEEQGHFKSQLDSLNDLYQVDDRPDGPCCIVANPAMQELYRLTDSDGFYNDQPYHDVQQAIGLMVRDKYNMISVTEWSDKTNTPVVLSDLRALADSLETEIEAIGTPA